MSFQSFGQVIPVTGPNIGFPGAVSRIGAPIIVARQVNPDADLNLHFGEPAVLIEDSTGGTWKSVADYIAGGASGADVTANFAGCAVREVKTNLTYPSGVTPGAVQNVGYYQPGEIGEVLELGSMTVKVVNGTPVANGKVYIRVHLNPGLPESEIGDIDADSDLAYTVGMPNAVFRTGYLDANNMAEITILVRHAA